jgi:hypothetical protein
MGDARPRSGRRVEARPEVYVLLYRAACVGQALVQGRPGAAIQAEKQHSASVSQGRPASLHPPQAPSPPFTFRPVGPRQLPLSGVRRFRGTFPPRPARPGNPGRSPGARRGGAPTGLMPN